MDKLKEERAELRQPLYSCWNDKRQRFRQPREVKHVVAEAVDVL
jgi:hypothetical protein